MEKKLVPTHKYKTSVVFLDDDVEFLAELQETVKSFAHDIKFVNNLNEFTSLVAESKQIKECLPCIVESMDNEVSDLMDGEALRVDLSIFNDIRQITNKAKEVTVVVVDHNLGGQNGIDICATLNDSCIERILLTGDCDYSEALNAMNEKKINFFIDKLPLSDRFSDFGDDDLEKNLLQKIDIAVDRYFISKDSYKNKLLCNRAFKKLYTTIAKSHDIIEHYLIEKDTMLLTSQLGQEFILKCWMDEDFDNYCKLYYDELDTLTSQRLEIIKNEKKLPIEGKLIDAIKFDELYYCLIDGENDAH